MSWKKSVLAGVMASVLLSLSTGAQGQSRRVAGGTADAEHSRQEPCWEVAGISKSTMQQRRLLIQETRQQVEAVCAKLSLSPTQKQEEIHQIHEREHQQLESLITPSQQEALRACWKERDHGGAHPRTRQVGDPCEVTTTPLNSHPSAEGEKNEEPPTEDNQPQ